MTNANLSTLTLSDGTLAPVFAPGTTSYTSYTTLSSITVTPTAAEPAAAIKVNGITVSSGSPSGSITMNYGLNTITIEVTSVSLIKQTYTITVTRCDVSNANLSNLTMSSGTLSPGFASGTTSYTSSVSVISLTVTPTASEPYSTIRVNGTIVTSGQASASLPIHYGSNTITIAVTSVNGTVKTYTVAVSRNTILTADFISSKRLYFDTTSAGANVSGNVTNFPVLIRTTDPAYIDATRPGAPDIRFVDKDGVTWLSYEIETWDQANNIAAVWVRVPQVDGNSTADYITMYYNDLYEGTIPDGQNKTDVFRTSDSFVGVWHMNQDPTLGIINNSTGISFNGAPAGSMNSADLVDGIIGKGIDFDGVDDVINCGKPAAIDSFEVTIEFWAYYNSASYAYRGIVGRSNGSTSDDMDYGLRMMGDGHFQHYHGEGIGGSQKDNDTGYSIPKQQWFHCAITFEDPGWIECIARLYVNGTEAYSHTYTGDYKSNDFEFRIGKNWDSSWLGKIDEVRLSTGVRSANWIKLNYANQKSGQTLVKW
jgi:hypothetical protein